MYTDVQELMFAWSRISDLFTIYTLDDFRLEWGNIRARGLVVQEDTLGMVRLRVLILLCTPMKWAWERGNCPYSPPSWFLFGVFGFNIFILIVKKKQTNYKKIGLTVSGSLVKIYYKKQA